MATPAYKLTYFDGPGRAEAARLAFIYSDTPFINAKISREQFAAIKSTLPQGQLPVLEVNGEVFCQSYAITRYVAKICGLYPEDPIDAMRVDCVLDTIVDATMVIGNINRPGLPEEEKAQKLNEFVNERIPTLGKYLTNLLKGKEHFIPEKTTIADLAVYTLYAKGLPYMVPGIKAPQELQPLIAKLDKNERIQAYYNPKSH